MVESENIDTNEVEKTVSFEENIPNYVTSRTAPKHGFCSSFCSPNRQRSIGKMLCTFGVAVWLIGLFFGIYGAIRVSLSTWRHYKESPIVISMERNYKEWNTSFPAVTICPLEKYDNDSLNKLVEELPYNDKLELRKFLVGLSEATYNTFDLVPEFPEIRPSEYLELLLKIKFKFSYSLWGSNSEANSVSFLTPTITERGLCYAFNSDIAIYNSPEYWQSKSNSLNPRGWSFVGNPLDGDIFQQIMGLNSGYVAYIHSSNETADFSSQTQISGMNYYKTMSMTALSVHSSENARSLSIEQRACRFLDESNLKISPVYSYNLCRNQCRMNLAYSTCKCVPYFYKPTHQRPICDVKGMHCLAKHKGMLSSLRYHSGEKVTCNCLPACNDVNYVIENEHTMPWFLGTNLKWGIKIYPKMRLRRDILFTFTDVLISVGSAIGLFLGCSLLSLVQAAYFICFCFYLCIRKIFKMFFICVKTRILGGKHRYLTSASSGRSTVQPSPIPAELVAKKLNCGGLNPTVVAQHI